MKRLVPWKWRAILPRAQRFQPNTPPEPSPTTWRGVGGPGWRGGELADTVGYSVPEEYGAMIGRMVKALGDSAIVSVHCHDDLGLAVGNSLAAIQYGARQIECTINGIGERAGNAALEEVVMAMNTRRDRLPFETRIDTRHLYP